MRDLPTGAPTFLFTDIEGSTRLLQELGASYDAVLAEHRRLLRAAWDEHNGYEVGTEGDSFFVAFARATDAVSAALSAQLAVSGSSWPNGASIRVRMGMHTGEARVVAEDYVGLAIHEAARISSAAHGGQIILSRTTHDLVRGDIPADAQLIDLGDHHLKDLPDALQLFQLCHPDLPGDFPPLRSLEVRRHNLPTQLTSFIGRESDLTDVCDLVANNRLVTLTGAGGSGKTRLALEAAARLLPDFADGVRVVELATVGDPDRVGQAFVSALGLREQEHATVEAVLENYFRPKDMLLVADNCEHLVRRCADLFERLLRSSPRLRIIATTREALGTPGEVTLRVPSLPVPESDTQQSAEELMRFPAVRLYVDRAVSLDPAFAPTSDDLLAIAQICRRLDGIPLAIELAAARTGVLTPLQISERLDDRFRLLTGGARTALARQQTLRALVDWSYDLLDADEQTVLAMISVFQGSASLDAIETVCAGGGLGSADILDVVSQLVSKSLVIADKRSGEMRYRLLETIRHYAREKLTPQEASSAHTAHRDFYLGLVSEAEPRLEGHGQVAAVKRIRDDYDNIRAAIEWSLAEPGSDVPLRLTTALWFYWFIRGEFAEARGWYEKALEAAKDSHEKLRANALWQAGLFAGFQSETDVGEEQVRQALELADRSGDARARGWGLIILHHVVVRGDLPPSDGKTLDEEALAIAHQIDDKFLACASLLSLGMYATTIEEQEPYFTEGLATAREIGETWHEGQFLRYLGIASARQEPARAEEFIRQALTIYRALEDKWGLAYTLGSLGGLIDASDEDAAHACWEEAVQLGRDTGSPELVEGLANFVAWTRHLRGNDVRALPWSLQAVDDARRGRSKITLASCLRTLGEIRRGLDETTAAKDAFAEALEALAGVDSESLRASIYASIAGLETTVLNYERAARLFGAAESLRESSGSVPDDPAGLERDLDLLRGAMDAATLEREWNLGRSQPVDEEITLALARS